MPDACDAVAACPWPGDKRWVYSITFDEALADLHRFTIPILEEHGVPGHVEVVVGQMGEVRHLGSSSYNGMRHMSAGELRDLLARGWGVGNHSWSHPMIDESNVERELGEAKRVLEEAIGEPVTIYCSPGNNRNMNETVLEACRRYGYLGAMAIHDGLNLPHDEDLMWLKRPYLHRLAPDGGGEIMESDFDPFRRIHLARRERGWIIDYLHCPLEEPVHPRKDCSQAELRDRIETVVGVGGNEVWLARVEDATDYRYLLRHLKIARGADGSLELTTPGLPPQVRRRTVTLSLPANARAVEVDGCSVEAYEGTNGRLADVNVTAKRRLRVVND